MESDTIKQKAEDLTAHLGDYAETFLKITLLNLTQKGANIASAAITTIVICGLALFVLFFVSFGLAWWMGDIVNNRTGGFMIIGGFYLLLLILVAALRKKTVFPYLRNLIIRKVYE